MQKSVDDVSVDIVEANYLDDKFIDSNGLIKSGTAECCQGNQLNLTPASPNVGGRAYYLADLNAARFSAQFRYRIGPDSSGGDGMVFMFYKNFAYTPTSSGGSNGFDDADTTTIVGHEGYGFELDGTYNVNNGDSNDDHVSLLKDRRNNQLWSKSGFEFPDGQWHTVNIDVFENKAVVYHEGRYLGTVNTGTVSHAFLGLGFGASTSSVSNYHQIDDLQISVAHELQVAIPSQCVDATSGEWAVLNDLIVGGPLDNTGSAPYSDWISSCKFTVRKFVYQVAEPYADLYASSVVAS